MNWILSTLFVAGHVLAASSSAAPAPSADPCDQCKEYDQTERAEALITGPYQDAWDALHSALIAKDYTNITLLSGAWRNSSQQVFDTMTDGGCMYYTTWPLCRTILLSYFNMVGVVDGTEDYNISDKAQPVFSAIRNSAIQLILVMQVVIRKQPSCYPCESISGLAEYLNLYNCYVDRLGRGVAGSDSLGEPRFCPENDNGCPVSSLSSSAAAPSSAAPPSSSTVSSAVPSVDPCNQCTVYDQKDRVEALISGPYETAWDALHSALEAKDFSNLDDLTDAWRRSVDQIVDLITKDGCLYIPTFSALRTLVISIFYMVGVGDNMEDYNIPDEARAVVRLTGRNAVQIIRIMRTANLAQPTCYKCEYVEGTTVDVNLFNCYAKYLGEPTIIVSPDFCPATIVDCPAIVSSISALSSTAPASSSGAVLSSGAGSSSGAVSSSGEVLSSAAISSSAGGSSRAVSYSEVSSSGVVLPSGNGSSQVVVSSPTAGSSQAIGSSQAAGSSQATIGSSTPGAASSLFIVPGGNFTSTQGSVLPAGSSVPASGSPSKGLSNDTSSQQASGANGGTVVTTVVTAFTTYCPEPTTFCVGDGKCYTATGATTITVTDCPCTLTTTCVPGEQPTAVNSNHAVPTMPPLTAGPANTEPAVPPEIQVSPVSSVAPETEMPSVASANVGSLSLPGPIAAILGAILLIYME